MGSRLAVPQLLAVCDNGHFFQSGFGFDPGGTGVTATLTIASEPRICPECGAHAHVLGGSYHVAENTLTSCKVPNVRGRSLRG